MATLSYKSSTYAYQTPVPTDTAYLDFYTGTQLGSFTVYSGQDTGEVTTSIETATFKPVISGPGGQRVGKLYIDGELVADGVQYTWTVIDGATIEWTDETTCRITTSGGGGGSTLSVTYNSTKIIDSLSVTPPVTVTYNGSTIATLNEGDTKTLDILGSDNKPKILATPIVIGGKTIPDVDALGRKWALEHNLVIEVGGITPTSETWIMKDFISQQADADLHFDVSFTSNGNQYVEFAVEYGMNGNMVAVFFDNFVTPVYMVNPYVSQKWVNQAYRTITLDEPATGDFLTWLQSNAVKQ